MTFLREVTAYGAKTVGITTAAAGRGYVHPITGEKVVHPLYDGMELSRNRFGPPEVNKTADVKVDATFDVVFDKRTPAAPHEFVTETLQTLSQATGDVLDAFAQFLP